MFLNYITTCNKNYGVVFAHELFGTFVFPPRSVSTSSLCKLILKKPLLISTCSHILLRQQCKQFARIRIVQCSTQRCKDHASNCTTNQFLSVFLVACSLITRAKSFTTCSFARKNKDNVSSSPAYSIGSNY